MFNIKMMRFRRYRVFLIFAALITLVLVRLNQEGSFGSASKVIHQGYKTSQDDSREPSKFDPKLEDDKHIDVESLAHPVGSAQDTFRPEPQAEAEADPIEAVKLNTPVASDVPTKTIPDVPAIQLPNRMPLPKSQDNDELAGTHMLPPGKQQPVLFTEPVPTIYWKKQEEHFPVSEPIQLPTGSPKAIPRIQFAFKDESTSAKVLRLDRQAKVKAEFKHAWEGYKAKAWTHDEVKPASGDVSDPFGGWAATLVDSLDSLHILGFEADFKLAVEQIGQTDFTTVNRNDIPVFETTIRYLGGLLAAYDVSGQTHTVLLDKARELGDVLLGAFDSPNRMPELFYRWKPAFASQPHRASVRANLAELGSLSLEFTRLAQLTKDARYYDAVARVTDALYEWQERGTSLSGIFPGNVDASGCNRTATDAKLKLPLLAEPGYGVHAGDAKGYEAPMLETVGEPPKRTKLGETGNLELSVIPGALGEPAQGRIDVVGENNDRVVKRTVPSDADLSGQYNNAGPGGWIPSTDEKIPGTFGSGAAVGAASTGTPRLAQGTRVVEDWDCVAQGLGPSFGAREEFSMGGGQDSTYEYFTKQFLLLGGLEPKYQTMYEKTLKAIKSDLLYRPMIPDDREILFSGKVTITSGVLGSPQAIAFDAENTHLTCFIGGMVGMGAKVFKSEQSDSDVEIAKALSDGCVWAYESTASGIMPENAKMIPCESFSDCPWNQTLWEHHLDPIWDKREGMIASYDENKRRIAAQREAEANEVKPLTADGDAQKPGEENQKADATTRSVEATEPPELWGESKVETEAMRTDVDSEAPPSTREGEHGDGKYTLRKRDDLLPLIDDASPKAEILKPITHDTRTEAETVRDVEQKDSRTDTSSGHSQHLQAPPGDTPEPNSREAKLYQKLKETEEELNATPYSKEGKQITGAVLTAPGGTTLDHDPNRPLSHTEYVAQQVQRNAVPKGYSTIHSNQYILRPEAIESVWYMYRITGDPVWQEKGWKMFESIIKATKVEFGHSAVRSITSATPTVADSMESFWLAETLKYFYLLYSEPDVISLDEWVLNTEAHPFKRPT